MSLSFVLAQKNWRVGDIEGNTQQIIELMQSHSSHDLIIFSELAICGYPPEDLIYRDDFKNRCQQALSAIKQASRQCGVIVGHPHWQDGLVYNSLSLFFAGQQLACYHKQQLPNYDVFDEKRYFAAGEQTCVVDFKGKKVGLLICEDLWQCEPIDRIAANCADLVISINASPYAYEKPQYRQELIKQHAVITALPIVYV